MLRASAAVPYGQIMDICRAIADAHPIVAACIHGPFVGGYGNEKSCINVLLILKNFGSMLRTYQKKVHDRDSFVLAVDQRAFQRDVSSGWLGEISADPLLITYEPLVNSDYLLRHEVALKKRVVWELLESLVLEFPELSHELAINEEYFMYETQMERAKLFPLVSFRFLNLLRSDVKLRNVESIMKGYRKALEELSQEKWITLTNGTIRVTPKLVNATKSRKIPIPMFLRSVQRVALRHIFSSLPRMLLPLVVEEEIYTKSHPDVNEIEDSALKLEDSRSRVLMPTSSGFIPLSDATSIEEFAKKAVPSATGVKVETREIGGVLNSVYLLTLLKDHEKQRIVVKKFRDWTGFKWFPLALWSLGTKRFAVLGKSRLEREYALNQYLLNNGLTVATILHVSPRQRLIFQEFVEGKTLEQTVKTILFSKVEAEQELELVKEAGRQIAKAHKLGVGLGDCKPENIIITEAERKLCFVDLEQASRDGDHAWDIAEFLYYSGHYVPPLSPTDKIELLTRTFIAGYIEEGGGRETVKKAASPRYTKVFSIFTQPHVTLAISNICRKVKGQ